MYGPIGAGFFGEGVSADSISQALKNAPDCKHILLRISSPGGAIFDGLAIRSMLSEHSAHVVCEVEGIAASAASIIAMGADVIKMHEGSALMMHRASVATRGNVAEHAKAVNALTALDDGMASVYAARSGMSKDDCVHMMDSETWLTPAQAVDKKFADEVVPAKKSASAPIAFDLRPFGYLNAPQQFTAQATLPAPLETKTMSFARIATAIGLDSSADEAAVISALGKVTSRAEERAQALEAPLAELRTLTSTSSNEAMIGAVRGFEAAAKQLPEMQAKIEAAAKAAEEAKRAALLAADASDTKGRKLTPAMITFWATQPVATFEAFLAVAPHQVQVTQPGTPQPAVSSTGAAVSGGAPQILTHEGKSWEQMSPAAKHNLRVDSPDVYEALRANHAERGSPRAQPTTQRASA